MSIQRRRFLRAAGVGTVLGLSGCAGEEGGSTATQGDAGTRERVESEESGGDGNAELTLATTTSTYDTGLLDELNAAFEERFDATIKTIPQGTGAAIETARNGDADVILVHARGAEDAFLRDGFGVNRRDVMFNDFVIVGPADDPAGINGASSATEAFATVAETQSTFVSRGDDSGTHKKEQNVWAESGVDPSGKWYREVGKGMGDTLVQASQSGAYTLADRGTFLSMKDEVNLTIHVQGPLKDGPTVLKNPYGVIPVNPAKYGDVNYQLAMAYVGFLTGPRGQDLIDGYTANGSQLFFPNALAEEPNFAQYVPEDWNGTNPSKEDIAFRAWVDRRVPEDF